MYRIFSAIALLPVLFWGGMSVVDAADIVELAQIAPLRPSTPLTLRPNTPLTLRPNTQIIVPTLRQTVPNLEVTGLPPIFSSPLAYVRGDRLWRISVSGSNFRAGQIGFVDFGGITFTALVEGSNLIVADPRIVRIRLNAPEVLAAFGNPLAVGDLVQIMVLDHAGQPISGPRFARLQDSPDGLDQDGDGGIDASVGGDDCDDNDPARFAGNSEVADFNGHDEDCDPTTIASGPIYTKPTDGDRDGDGFIDDRVFNVDRSGRRITGRDCDDQNPQINPFQTEARNGIDDDCDGQVDEGLL